MLEVKVKKIKFPDVEDATGEPFGKNMDVISLQKSDKVTSVLDRLKEIWQNTCPQMVDLIAEPKNLTLVGRGKIFAWDKNLSDYNLEAGMNFVLTHKCAPKLAPKPLGYDNTVEMEPEEKKKEQEVKPILEQVTENDIDRSALNQLLMLGYEKDISLLALRNVGTQYGSLGYDGLNKAIDWIQKKRIKDAEKLTNPLSENEQANLDAAERDKLNKVKFLEMQKRASSDAKQRYQHLQSKMGNAETVIELNSKELTNCYSFGRGTKGQLGHGEQLLMTSLPTKIKSLKGVKIDRVACGPRNTLFLSGDNHLYKTNMASCVPVRIFNRELADERLIDIAAGSSHFLLLNDEGSVLSWGDNDVGQLGHGEGVKQNTPKKIDTLAKIFINRISCGAVHSMAVSKTGNAFVWGSNIRGQLGYDPKSCKYLSLPTKICLMLADSKDEDLKVEEEEEKVEEIKDPEGLAFNKRKDLLDLVSHGVCGTWSSIFITEATKTRLHVWGGEEDIVNSTVVLYNNISDSKSIQFIRSRGNMILYLNKSGDLFEYSIKSKQSKMIHNIDKFKDLSLGSGYIGVVQHDNTLYMRGINKEGQLGTGDKESRLKEFELITTMEPTRIDSIICGIANTVAISKFEEPCINDKMADLMITKMLDKPSKENPENSIFKNNPESKKLLSLIIKNMSASTFDSHTGASRILSALLGPISMPDLDLKTLASTLEDMELLAVILENNPSEKAEYGQKCIKMIRFLANRIQRLKSIRSRYSLEEEEKEINNFELERIKQELSMRGQSAAIAQDVRVADYRRRVRDIDMNLDAVREGNMHNIPIMPNMPNMADISTRPTQVDNAFESEGEEADDMNVDQQEEHNEEGEEGNEEEDERQNSNGEEDMDVDDRQEEAKEPFSGGGTRLGGASNEEQEDPKAARLKWLEKMGKK